MFNAILKVQWKATRVPVLIATLLGFAIPLYSGRSFFGLGALAESLSAAEVVRQMQSASALYAFLAGAAGLSVAILAWAADHKGRHVYALSLPVSRARYAMMRFAAGSLFLLLPAAGVIAGCLATIAAVDLPPGMHAYPVALTIRFLLACFVAFAVFFAIAASSQRAAGYILGGIAGVVVIGLLFESMGLDPEILPRVGSLFFTEPGLLSIFTGRWMLFDV